MCVFVCCVIFSKKIGNISQNCTRIFLTKHFPNFGLKSHKKNTVPNVVQKEH